MISIAIYFVIVFFSCYALILHRGSLTTVNGPDKLTSWTFRYECILSFLCKLSSILDGLRSAHIVTTYKFCLNLLSQSTWSCNLLLTCCLTLAGARLHKLIWMRFRPNLDLMSIIYEGAMLLLAKRLVSENHLACWYIDLIDMVHDHRLYWLLDRRLNTLD